MSSTRDEMLLELTAWRDSYGPPRWKNRAMHALIGDIIAVVEADDPADRRALDELRSECEAVGLPLTASGLVRHWRNNTATTYALDLHTASHLIGQLLEGRDDELAERARTFLEHLDESKAAAQTGDDTPAATGPATGTDPAVIDWESLPVPTNVEIAKHLRAGGKIMMRWDDAPGGWAENPCGNHDPAGWLGTPSHPRGEFAVEDYRLAPITGDTEDPT